MSFQSGFFAYLNANTSTPRIRRKIDTSLSSLPLEEKKMPKCKSVDRFPNTLPNKCEFELFEKDLFQIDCLWIDVQWENYVQRKDFISTSPQTKKKENRQTAKENDWIIDKFIIPNSCRLSLERK